MSFYSESTHKSRKRRRCKCSGASIEIGEPYVSVRGVWDGDFFAISIHPLVHPIFDRRNQETYKAEWGEPLAFEDLLEDILERDDHPQREADGAVIASLPGVPEWFGKRLRSAKEGCTP